MAHLEVHGGTVMPGCICVLAGRMLMPPVALLCGCCAALQEAEKAAAALAEKQRLEAVAKAEKDAAQRLADGEAGL